MASQVMPRTPTVARGPVGRPRGWGLSPQQRKAVLAAHIALSVGLLGISAAMLVLGTVAAATSDTGTARAAYVSMGIFTKGVTQVGAIGTLATGVILSLGTKWGLFRHYWIVAKLALTVAAVLCGIFVVGPSVRQASAATSAATPPGAPDGGGTPALIVAAAAANVILLGAATVISVYKPWGTIAGRALPARGEVGDGRVG